MMQSLEDIYEDIWRSLKDSVEKKGHPFRYPGIATWSGEKVKQRMVVVRNIFISSRTILFHTDKRSRKVSHIKKHPDVSYLFYDPHRRIQVQMEGLSELHLSDTELHTDEWLNINEFERKRYARKGVPGSPLPERNRTQNEEADGHTESGKSNFIVITTEIQSIDWLNLHPEGERRALYQWAGDKWDKQHIIP